MSKKKCAVHTEDLSKKFSKKAVHALDAVSLNIYAGEAVALLGANGAGKTTLIRILASILAPTSGCAEIFGFDVTQKPLETKKRMGILFAGDALYDRLSGSENILYHAALRSLPKKKAEKNLSRLVDMLDMGSFIDRPASSYSRGMKQKSSIARSVIHDPDIMILDEPSTGLDIASGRAIREFMKQSRRDGKTLIFSSHNAREIEECAGRIIMLHNGKVVCDMNARPFNNRFHGGVEDAYYTFTEDSK
jgi:sodium transport system ATP-binding protein